MSESTQTSTKNQQNNNTNNNGKSNNNNTNTNKTNQYNYKRIKIEPLPRDVTRDHIEELCSKFGRVNEIEMKRSGNELKSFVTFFSYVDAEYALYRLLDTIYMGEKLRVSPEELTEKEILARQEEAKDRERRRIEGIDKKRNNKKTKGSLRHLAPINPPNVGNTQRNVQSGNYQNKNQGNEGNESQKFRTQRKTGNNGQTNKSTQGNKSQRNQSQRNQTTKRTNQSSVPRNQQGNNENRNQSKGGKYRVKNTQQNENRNQDEQNDGPNIYEVSIRNTVTGKQLLNTLVTQDVLQSLPSELKSKIDSE